MEKIILSLALALWCFGVYYGAQAQRKKLAMYYANWTVDRGCPIAGNLTHAADDLDVILYAFADINTKTGKAILSDPAVDVGYGSSWFTSNFYKLMRLKAANPHLKIMLSVGGWSYRNKFKTIVDKGLLNTFARSCITLLTQATVSGHRYTYAHLFDGIDIDWEFDDGDPGTYATAYLQLVRACKSAITASGKAYLLSVALQAAQAAYAGANAIDVKTLAGLVSWINFMTYDFHGTWEATTNFAAPLYGRATSDTLAVDYAVKGLLRKQVPASKILLGMSYVGNTYKGVTVGTTHGLRQHTTGPAAGSVLGKYGAGSIYYKTVVAYLLSCANCGRNGYTYYWDTKQRASWLYNKNKKFFVSYESPASARLKSFYVKNKGLGGVMCWEMCADTNGAALTGMIRNSLD